MEQLLIERKVRGSNRFPETVVTEVIGYALVDDELFDRLAQTRWSLHSGGYAQSREIGSASRGRKKIYLHHLVWRLSERELPEWPLTIDHKDRNRLNCLLGNLRVADQVMQKMNAKKRVACTSQFKGVYYCSDRKRFCAQIRVCGKVTHIGRFVREKDAAEAYRNKHLELHGFAPVH